MLCGSAAVGQLAATAAGLAPKDTARSLQNPFPPMAHPHRWSVTLVAAGDRHPRWLDENGHFSSDPGRALRLTSPEVAVQRVQTFLELHGWDPAVMERFRLVPAPAALKIGTPRVRYRPPGEGSGGLEHSQAA